MTVKQLRQSGYKVKVLHYRVIKFTPKRLIHNLGGSTQVIIDGPDGEHFEGKAICSKFDNYNKKLGVKIALGRAMLNHTDKVV